MIDSRAKLKFKLRAQPGLKYWSKVFSRDKSLQHYGNFDVLLSDILDAIESVQPVTANNGLPMTDDEFDEMVWEQWPEGSHEFDKRYGAFFAWNRLKQRLEENE